LEKRKAEKQDPLAIIRYWGTEVRRRAWRMNKTSRIEISEVLSALFELREIFRTGFALSKQSRNAEEPNCRRAGIRR
jgi:hypothetical protein